MGLWQSLRRRCSSTGAITSWIGRRSWPLSFPKTDATSLRYVVEALAAHMWRKNEADPYGSTELKRVIGEVKWARSYIRTILPPVF